MKKEFVVERMGKMFVLYAGLLDEAHAQGLKSIVTSMLQIPADDNGRVAICQATVETEKGVFTGIGDAAPNNVAAPMTNCTIRLAETRAKARALRDAVNVGVAALEELGDDDDAAPPRLKNEDRHRAIAEAPMHNPALTPRNGNDAIAANGGTATTGLATPAQVRAIYLIARDQRGLGNAEVEQECTSQFGSTPESLTKKQASEFITSLRNKG